MADEIKYSDIISPEVQIQLNQLAATVKALTAELEKLNKATAKEDATSENYNDTLRDQVEITDDLLRLTQDELVLKKQITKVQKQYDQAVEEGSINADEYGIALKKGKENLSKLGFELRNAAKLTNATKTSMTNLSLELGKNRMKYRDLTKAQRENRKEGGQLLKTIQKQDKAIKKLDAAIGNNQRNVGNYKSALSGLGSEMGSFGMATNTVTKALGFLKIGFKSVKVALMSTGIGALVVAFGSLVTYFQSTHDGAVKLEKILAPFKVTFLVLKDLAADLGEYLYNAFSDPKQLIIDLWEGIKTNLLNRLESSKKFLSAFGDLLQGVWDWDTDKMTQAGKDMGNSYIDMMTGVIDTTGKAKKVVEDYATVMVGYYDEVAKKTAQEIALIERQHALEKKQLAFKTQSAKLDAEIASARLEAQQQRGKDDDAAVMAQERAMSLTKERFDLERGILAEQIAIEEQRQSMFDTTYEDQVKLADMKNSLITLDTTQDGLLRTMTEQYRTLAKAAMEYWDIEIDIDDDDSDVDKFKKTYDDLNKMRRADVDAEMLAWQDKNTTLEDGLKTGLLLKDEYNTRKRANDQAYYEYVKREEQELQLLKAQVTANFIGNLADAAEAMGANAEAVKAMRIAETVINTYASATAAFNSLATIPVVGTVLGAIAAAGAIAAGLANVAKIQNTSVPSYAVGAEELESDQMANVHKGERILPAYLNKQINGIDNVDLPRLVNIGLNAPKIFDGIEDMIAQQQSTNNLLSRFAYVEKSGTVIYLSGDKKYYV